MESSKHLSEGNEITITADSIVVHDGHILGKPTGAREARSVLQQLSGGTHIVYTGVCLSRGPIIKTLLSATEVQFYPFDDEEIEYYINHYKPYDKAGSYGIQEWIGLCRVRSIRGSYNNVIGLPVALIYETLKRHFI